MFDREKKRVEGTGGEEVEEVVGELGAEVAGEVAEAEGAAAGDEEVGGGEHAHVELRLPAPQVLHQLPGLQLGSRVRVRE